MDTTPKSEACTPIVGYTPDGTPVCLGPPPILCESPAVQVCDAIRCSCQVPISAMACQVSIVYRQGDPTTPVLMPMAPYCDGAGAELALAIILARVLGAKP